MDRARTEHGVADRVGAAGAARGGRALRGDGPRGGLADRAAEGRRRLGRAAVHGNRISRRLLHQLRAVPSGVPRDGPRSLGAVHFVSATAERSSALPDSAEVLVQAGSENFPVASRLLPRRQRGHLMSLYGYARLVDDAGDEAPGDRTALLN